MKRITLLLSLLLICITGLKAQPLNKLHWEIIKLSTDSSLPVKFIAYDSLHAVMFTRKDSTYIDSLNFLQFKQPSYYFETSDGGKSWKEIIDTTFNRFGGSTLYGADIWGYPLLADRTTRYWSFQPSTGGYGARFEKSQSVSNSFRNMFHRTHGSYQLVTTLTPTNPVIYSGDSGCLYRSIDGGATFPYRYGGEEFRRIMHPSLSNDSNLFGGIGCYVNKDLFNHTFIVKSPRDVQDSSDTLLQLFPPGLTVMITSSGGAAWTSHRTQYPKDNLANHHPQWDLQYISSKERLFLSSSAFLP